MNVKRGHTVVRSIPNLNGFEYVKTLGSGGFATSYLYKDLHREFGDHVVVKVPHDKQHELALLKGDAASLATLRNQPNIVQYYDIRLAKERYILLMEYVKGPSIRDLLGSVGKGKSLAVEKAVKYALQIAYGLKTAHKKQMVHRDIKPENIIIEATSDTPKILDFGIASLTKKSGVFETVLYRRTVAYTPLEILEEGKGDHRVDIFSLGVTFYEMITGNLPYFQPNATEHQTIQMMRAGKAPSPRHLVPGLPRYVDDVVHKAIAPHKDQRYQDISLFISDLEQPTQLRIAEDHQRRGAVRKADRILRTLIDQRPNDSRGFIALASLMNRCQRFLEANDILSKAIAIDPFDPSLHMRLGVNMAQVKNYHKAADHLKQAYKLAQNATMKRKIKLLQRTMLKNNN